jgi:hypothetical protein
MKIYLHVVSAALAFAVWLPCQSPARVEYLKEEPPKGALPFRKVVYVEDGTSPNL